MYIYIYIYVFVYEYIFICIYTPFAFVLGFRETVKKKDRATESERDGGRKDMMNMLLQLEDVDFHITAYKSISHAKG